MTITLEEALLGYEAVIAHLGNRKFHVTQDQVTKPFEIRILEREGMPIQESPSDHGDLHIAHHIAFPQSLTAEQKDLVRSLLPE